MVPAGVRERRGIEVGEALGHRGAEFAAVHRVAGDHGPREREHGLEIDPFEGGPVLGMPREFLFQDRLHQWTEAETVLGAHQVDRRPHQGDPHQGPILDPLTQRGWIEGLDA